MDQSEDSAGSLLTDQHLEDWFSETRPGKVSVEAESVLAAAQEALALAQVLLRHYQDMTGRSMEPDKGPEA